MTTELVQVCVAGTFRVGTTLQDVGVSGLVSWLCWSSRCWRACACCARSHAWYWRCWACSSLTCCCCNCSSCHCCCCTSQYSLHFHEKSFVLSDIQSWKEWTEVWWEWGVCRWPSNCDCSLWCCLKEWKNWLINTRNTKRCECLSVYNTSAYSTAYKITHLHSRHQCFRYLYYCTNHSIYTYQMYCTEYRRKYCTYWTKYHRKYLICITNDIKTKSVGFIIWRNCRTVPAYGTSACAHALLKRFGYLYHTSSKYHTYCTKHLGGNKCNV